MVAWSFLSYSCASCAWAFSQLIIVLNGTACTTGIWPVNVTISSAPLIVSILLLRDFFTLPNVPGSLVEPSRPSRPTTELDLQTNPPSSGVPIIPQAKKPWDWMKCDISTALAEITYEPAQALLKLELRRLDDLTATFYPNATEGDIPSAMMVLKLSQHRASLLGWGTKEHAAKLTITDGAGGGEPRRLELEFILPGKRIASMADQPSSSWTPSSSVRIPDSEMEEALARNEELRRKLRITPEESDIVIEKDMPSSMKKTYGGYDQG
jgi:hypothetical protein